MVCSISAVLKHTSHFVTEYYTDIQQELQIRNTRYHFTHIRMAIIKKKDNGKS